MAVFTIDERKDLKHGMKMGTVLGSAGLLSRTLVQKPLGKNDLPASALSAMRGLGFAGIIYGVAGHNSRPELATKMGGLGLGLSVASLPVNWLISKMPSLGANNAKHNSIPTGPDAIDMEVYDIPDVLGRKYGYERVSNLLKKFVLEDTVNKKTGETIPAGYKHPSIVWLTRNILASNGVSVYNPIAVAQCISDWCWNNLTYVFDPMTSEAEDYFVHPYLLVRDYSDRGFAAGDCDDFAVLTAAMLLSVGLTPRFLLWAQQPEAPEAYTHITTALYLPEYRYPDLKNTFAGWPYYNIEATMKVDSNDYKTGGVQGATPGGYNYHPSTFKRGVIIITE